MVVRRTGRGGGEKRKYELRDDRGAAQEEISEGDQARERVAVGGCFASSSI